MKKIFALFMVMVMVSTAIFFLSGKSATGNIIKGEACKDCNVILISFDALRADHLGVYGYEKNTSPNIDAFSEDSLVFENCISQAPWTLPSHVSMLTGEYPSHHGAMKATSELGNSTITIADILHDKGYKTVAFTGGGFTSKKYNYHTFDIFNDTKTTNNSMEIQNVINWVDSNSKGKFFLFWHTFSTHAPYAPSKQFDVFSDKNYNGMLNSLNSSALQKILKESINNLTQEDIDYMISKYDGGILEADYNFGELIKELKEKNILDKTIIIVVSDHGESFAEREEQKRIGHVILYKEVMHVPLIVRIPGVPGNKMQGTVELIDIMPTVLSILNMQVPDSVDGKSLFSASTADFAYSENSYHEERSSLIYKNYHLIHDKNNNTFEFYNLNNDPEERNNLFGNKSEEESLMVREILRRESVNHSAGKTENAEMDEELVEQLKALGYAN